MEQILTQYAIAIYLIFILIEAFISHLHKLHWYKAKDSLVSIAYGIFGLVLDLLMKGVTFGVLNFISTNYGLIKWANYTPIYMWLGIFIAQDFCFYWLHRAEHYCRVLWAVHSNHHSSQYFNFTVALRSSVLQPLYRYVFFIPCAILGFDGLTIMFMYALNQYWAFFVHTKSIGKMGVLEYFLVTPSHHRVHHASNIAYLDKNMGQVLIIWDKIFGTFAKENEEVVYGLTTNLKNFNPITSVFHEWEKIYNDLKKNVSFTTKLKYLFYPPGWSHDGSTKTSNQLRKEDIK